MFCGVVTVFSGSFGIPLHRLLEPLLEVGVLAVVGTAYAAVKVDAALLVGAVPEGGVGPDAHEVSLPYRNPKTTPTR
jgi:hypothetical protein